MRLARLDAPLKITERGEAMLGYSTQSAATLMDADDMTRMQGRHAWTQRLVEFEKSRLASEFNRLAASRDFASAISWIMRLLSQHEDESTVNGKLTSFCAALALLELDLTHDFLAPAERKRLLELAEAILKVQGIDAKSRLGYLLADARQAKALDASRRGRTWEAFFEQVASWQAGRRSMAVGFKGKAALQAGLRALRLGNIGLAIEALHAAEDLGLDQDSRVLARIARIQALRLSGELVQAEALLLVTKEDSQLSEEAILELDWEAAIIQGMQGDEDAWRHLFNLCRRGKPHYQATYLLEAHLWARVMPSNKYLLQLPKLSTIKTNAGASLTRNVRFAQLIAAVSTLEMLYETGPKAEVKLATLGELSENLASFSGIDRELLVKLALWRWAQRHNQGLIAALLQSEYQALSAKLSRGGSEDVLGLGPKDKVQSWGKIFASAVSEKDEAATLGGEALLVGA